MIVPGVVVVYNPDDSVIDNIMSYIDDLSELYIIDNSESVNKNFYQRLVYNEKIIYKIIGGNIGLPAAINIGFELLKEKGYEYAIYFDQDTKKIDDFKLYFSILDDIPNDVGMIVPSLCIDRKKIKNNKREIQNVNFAMSSAAIYNLNIFNIIGKFDEKLFLDCLDEEYCLKLRKNGYKIIQVNKFKVEHHPAITIEKKKLFLKFKTGYHSPIRYYYQIRNMYFCYRKYHNFHSLKWLLIKKIKAYFIFSDNIEYKIMAKKAKKDFKEGKYGKYIE